MTDKRSASPAPARRRTAEERRRQASRQTRTFRAAAPAVKTVERRARPGRQSRRLVVRRPGKGQVLALALAVVLAAAVAFGFLDSRFYVSSADIRGVQYSPPGQIYQQAGVDGYSIFWVNARAAAERIEALPYVKQAVVQTWLPNHLRIEVVERAPVALWRVNGQEMWVDVEGATMPVANPSLALPVFADLDGSSVRSDGGVDQQLIASVHQLKQQLPEINEFAYDRINGLQFRLAGGTGVLLGKPEGLAQRVQELLVLQGSLASLPQMPLEIDWRFDDGYTLKMP